MRSFTKLLVLSCFFEFSTLASDGHFVVLDCDGVFQHALPARAIPLSRPSDSGLMRLVATEDDPYSDPWLDEMRILGGSAEFVFTTKGLGDSLGIWSHRTGREVGMLPKLSSNIRSLQFSELLKILGTVDGSGDLTLHFSLQYDISRTLDFEENVNMFSFANKASFDSKQATQFMQVNSTSGIRVFRITRSVRENSFELPNEQFEASSGEHDVRLNSFEGWLKHMQSSARRRDPVIENRIEHEYTIPGKAVFSAFSDDGQYLIWITVDPESRATFIHRQNLDLLDNPSGFNAEESFRIDDLQIAKNLSYLSASGDGELVVLGYQNGEILFLNFLTQALSKTIPQGGSGHHNAVVSSHCSAPSAGIRLITVTINDGTQLRYFWSSGEEPALIGTTGARRTTLEPKPLGYRTGMF